MAVKISVNTGNIELDNKINEWLKWNKVSNLMIFYMKCIFYVNLQIFTLFMKYVLGYSC